MQLADLGRAEGVDRRGFHINLSVGRLYGPGGSGFFPGIQVI
jgi:hypothetical protein